MSISDLHPHPGHRGDPATVLAQVVASLRDLDDTWWTHQTDEDLVATVELVEQADRPRPARPTLRLPRLRPATGDVPRPPHHPLDIRR